jgi:hypothetical protein
MFYSRRLRVAVSYECGNYYHFSVIIQVIHSKERDWTYHSTKFDQLLVHKGPNIWRWSVRNIETLEGILDVLELVACKER